MKTSAVKFDDLAFILLFFFMIVAVISFSESAEYSDSAKVSESVQGVDQIHKISVYLDLNGNFSVSEFSKDMDILLSCDAGLSWEKVSSAVVFLSEKVNSVELVI